MPWSVVLNGTTFTNSNVEGNAYADEVNGLPAMFGAFAKEAEFLKGATASSSTSVTPATGAQTFTTNEAPDAASFSAGSFLRAISISDPTSYMIGSVSSYSGNTLVIDVSLAAGTTQSDWVLGHPNVGNHELVNDATPELGGTLEAGGNDISNVGTFTASSLGGSLDAGGNDISNVGSATIATLLATALGSNLDAADFILSRATLKDYAETVVTANSGAAYTADLEVANVYDLTLTDNCILTFSNPPASGTSGSITLILSQDAAGSRTVTWPAGVIWAGGSAPTLTATASTGVDVFTLLTVDGGATWFGFAAGQEFS